MEKEEAVGNAKNSWPDRLLEPVVNRLLRWVNLSHLSGVNTPMSVPVAVLFWCGFNVAAITLFVAVIALDAAGDIAARRRGEEGRPGGKFDRLLAPIAQRIPRWIKPNHLSLARVPMLVPVALLSWRGFNAWATASFVLAVVLDLLDGPLARLRGEESKEGEWLDAYADKVLVIGLFWLFWFWDSVGIALGQLVAITAAEAILVLGRPFKVKRGRSGRANNWGKAKMWYQSLAVVSITVGQDYTVRATSNLLWIALGLGLLSLAGHIRDIFARSQ